jgi:uncharacterized membrane protein
MNLGLVHLALNHFPVVLIPVAMGFLFFGWALKNQNFTKTALWLFVVAGMFAIPTYFTGESAEELIEHVYPQGKSFIHAHEEAAELSLIVVEVLACLSCSILWALAKGKKIVKPIWLTLALLSLFSCLTLLDTSHKGGMIHHEEVRGQTELKSEH